MASLCIRSRPGFYWLFSQVDTVPAQSAPERRSAVPGREWSAGSSVLVDKLLLRRYCSRKCRSLPLRHSATDTYQQLRFFYDDYAKSSSVSTAFDDQVKSDSIAAGGQDYLSLTSLAARQAFGAIEYTNTPTEPWLFMKEISSDGNVNTADGRRNSDRSTRMH